MKFELDDEIYSNIKYFSEKGDKYQNLKNFEKAIEMYKNALVLVPDPKNSWEAATWLLTAMGENFFFMKEFQSGIQSLKEALKCPGGSKNPFIHLRLGQCFFELSDFYEAKKEFITALDLNFDDSIFEGEDVKYYNSTIN